MSEPSVPLRDHLEALRAADNRRIDDLRQADLKAVETAMERSKEILALHNDLIRKGERAAATYITRGQVYAGLGTVLVVLGLLIAWSATGGVG
jgi:hypothetical protein